MENCGNFLEYAGSKCGIDVGYGKMILVYPTKKAVQLAELTHSAINAAVISGQIIGIIKGWHTIAGAPVAEVSVERTGTSEMKLIRKEIAADTLSFENSLANNEILGDVVTAGSLNCLLIDDQGNVFGEASKLTNQIETMLLNFSSKTTSAFQGDNVSDKMVSVTVRYLVKELDALIAEVETELVNSKSLVTIGIVGIDYLTTGVTATFYLKNKSTGKNLTAAEAGDVLLADVRIAVDGIPDAAVDSFTISALGLITMVIDSPSLIAFPSAVGHVVMSISSDEYYLKEILLPTNEI